MANFYKDNNDIQFLFKHIDLGKLAAVCEEDFRFAGEFDTAPAGVGEAIENYNMVLDSLGQLCGDFIASRAEDVDRQGNFLNEDGSVTRAKGIAEAIEKLGQAEVMGFTLPHRFGFQPIKPWTAAKQKNGLGSCFGLHDRRCDDGSGQDVGYGRLPGARIDYVMAQDVSLHPTPPVLARGGNTATMKM